MFDTRTFIDIVPSTCFQYQWNYADNISVQPGGKGVNISKALKSFGKNCETYIVLGKENAERFENLMDIPYIPIYAEGKIRENITIHSDLNPETRISLDNFCLSDDRLKEIATSIVNACDENTIVTITGRMPKGISDDAIHELCNEIKAKNAKLVIDSNSFSLDMLTDIKPWLIKPNEEEISRFFRSCHTLAEAEEIAKILNGEGIENVMISMGKLGIAYAGNSENFSIKSPAINALSTVGAGDSAISGFIYAYSNNLEALSCVQYACAFGSASCLTEGSLPPLKEDVIELLEKIKQM